jgi:CRP/FNR family transcriptional regulator
MKPVSCSVCLLRLEAAKNLDIPELKMPGNSCVEAAFKKGETIFKQNALSSNIIYLQTGLVKLTMEGPQRTQILRLKKAPCYLGLPTTMGDKINHYSAVALEPSTACFIDIHVFKKLLNINPEFSYEILTGMCRNELEQFHRCLHLVQSQIYGRLAGTLLYLSDEIYGADAYDLPLSRNDMADLVCTSRETISRLLNALAKEDIIAVRGKHIRILDRPRLEKIRETG